MASIVVPLTGAPELFGRMRAAVETGISRGLASAALRAKTVMDHAVQVAPPASSRGSRGAFNTGDYRRRWKALAIQAADMRGVLVSNDAAYAGVIEYGRRPGARAPPSEAIARWLQRKLTIPYEEAKSRSFLIARAIKRRGLLPRHVLTSDRTQTALRQAFQAEIQHEVERAVREIR